MIDYKPSRREVERNRKSLIRGMLYLIIFICILGILEYFVKPVKEVKTIKSHAEVPPSIRQIQMTEYFRRSGNKHPALMAQAVLKTKKPKLLAAVAVKGERNTPYTVRKGGYKKRHAGAWQQNEKYWGLVPHDPLNQALKAERDLEGLIAEKGNIVTALNQWGGDKTKKVYAKNILAELENIP
jgi:hypothetical protein